MCKAIEIEINNIIDLYYQNCNYLNQIIGISNDFLHFYRKNSIKKIKQKDIEKYIKYLKLKNNSNSTINCKLAFLSKILKYYNISLKLPYQKVTNTIKPTVTTDLFNKLINDFKTNQEMYNFIMLAYYTGMRANEILNICKQHVIKNNNQFFINLYNTKNHKDNVIPCNFKLNDILENFNEFTLNYKQVYYLLKKYNITPHYFRHTFITNCYDKNIDTFSIMRLTNQQSLSVHNRYVHIGNKRLSAVVNSL